MIYILIILDILIIIVLAIINIRAFGKLDKFEDQLRKLENILSRGVK